MMRLPSQWERYAMERDVLRCCKDSISGWLLRHPNGPVEGSRDFCNHCGSDFVWTKGAWEIDEPATFTRLRQEYARTKDTGPAARAYTRLNKALTDYGQAATPQKNVIESFV